MKLRTKGEQRAYLEGYEMCAECIEKYLSEDGKKRLEALLTAVRNAVDIEDLPDSAKGEYIKKNDATKALSDHFMYLQRLKHDEGNGCKKYEQAGINWCLNTLNELPTYSFLESKEMKQLYSDLLRVKHGTMNIDSLIDKVYADMRGKE